MEETSSGSGQTAAATPPTRTDIIRPCRLHPVQTCSLEFLSRFKIKIANTHWDSGSKPYEENPGTDHGRNRLEFDLRDKFNIVVKPAFAHDSHDGRIWLGITAQMYNQIKDYEKLGDAVLALC